MIEVVDIFGSGMNRIYYNAQIWSHSRVGSFRWISSPTINGRAVESWRSKYDYLKQGSSLGMDFRSVDNRQVTARVYPVSVINGYSINHVPSVSSSFRVKYFSYPPSVRSGSYWYFLLDVQPFELVGWWNLAGTPKRQQCYCVVAKSIRTGRRAEVIYASCSATYAVKNGEPTGKPIGTDAGVKQYSSVPRTSDAQAYASVMLRSQDASGAENQCLRVAKDLLAWASSACYADCARYPSGALPTSRISISSIDTPDFDYGELDKHLQYVVDMTTPHLFSAAELSTDARQLVEGLNNVSSNMLAYASDLRKTGDTIRSVLQLARDVKNPRKWAAAWLSGRYGDRLTVSDTRELLEAALKQYARSSRLSRSRVRRFAIDTYGAISVATTQASTLIARDESYNDIMTSIKHLMAWDAWPTLENTWDMIPLSFVVDWVLPVSDILNQIDAAIETPYIVPVVSCRGVQTLSRYVITSSTSAIGGNIAVKQYSRYRANLLNEIQLFADDISFLPSFSVVNAGDALALTKTLSGHR